MAKRKNLLLTESTTMRMMGLAGIGSLANPFLKENYGEEDTMNVMEMDDNFDAEEFEDDEGSLFKDAEEDLDDEGSLFKDEEEGESLEEGETCESCGMKEGKHSYDCGSKMNENITKSLKRLKKLLEQAEAPAPEEAPTAEPPPAMEGGDDAMEDKIKEFVKKLGELVQETLGVQVTVEEQEEEPEGGAELPAPEGEAGAVPPPPAPMAEAINRLVNKVARRVKARLMEAKKESEKKKPSKKELEDLEGLEAHYGEEMRAGIKGKHSHKSRMAALQAAKSNLKEKQMAAKKKEMQMKALKEKQAATKKKEAEAAKKKKEMEMKKKAAMAKKK